MFHVTCAPPCALQRPNLCVAMRASVASGLSRSAAMARSRAAVSLGARRFRFRRGRLRGRPRGRPRCFWIGRSGISASEFRNSGANTAARICAASRGSPGPARALSSRRAGPRSGSVSASGKMPPSARGRERGTRERMVCRSDTGQKLQAIHTHVTNPRGSHAVECIWCRPMHFVALQSIHVST